MCFQESPKPTVAFAPSLVVSSSSSRHTVRLSSSSLVQNPLSKELVPHRRCSPVNMATVSRPRFSSSQSDDSLSWLHEDNPVHKPVLEVPEVAAISATICEFMNKEHVRDIANYVVRFGRKFDDLSQLTQVRMTELDAAGFTTDVVSCDDTSHCVCVQERLDWPLGMCLSPSDVISALKHLSLACGLPADF